MTTFRLRPTFDRLIVRRSPPDEKTKGGIYIPEDSRGKSTEGKVVAAGGDCKHVHEGDTVVFSDVAGFILLDRSEGFETLLMREHDVLCVKEFAQ